MGKSRSDFHGAVRSPPGSSNQMAGAVGEDLLSGGHVTLGEVSSRASMPVL